MDEDEENNVADQNTIKRHAVIGNCLGKPDYTPYCIIGL